MAKGSGASAAAAAAATAAAVAAAAAAALEAEVKAECSRNPRLVDGIPPMVHISMTWEHALMVDRKARPGIFRVWV